MRIAALVKDVLEHRGWKDVIHPMLVKWRELCHSQAETETDRQKRDECVLQAAAISRLLRFLEVVLADGKRAEEEFRRLIGVSPQPSRPDDTGM